MKTIITQGKKMSPFSTKTLCLVTALLIPNFVFAADKEKMVDEFIQTTHGALTPEALEELSKTLPNPFQEQFGEEQEKFNKIYQDHAKKLATAMQKRQVEMMNKVLKPVYIKEYSEEELKGILELNKKPVNEKMRKTTPELMGASSEMAQKFMTIFGQGYGLIKTMDLSLKEARSAGLNKEALDKADAIFKENTQGADLAAMAKQLEMGTPQAAASNLDPKKQKLIDQLLGAQLSEQLKPLFANLGQAIPNKFDAQFGGEQDKFNAIFEKNRKSVIDEFSNHFMGKMKSIMQNLYAKHFSEGELEELWAIQNHPLMKKQMEVGMKVAAMGPAFAKAQEEMQNNPELEVYLEIFQEAKKQGMKSPKIDEMLTNMKAKAGK
jgi:hypothetical protein